MRLDYVETRGSGRRSATWPATDRNQILVPQPRSNRHDEVTLESIVEKTRELQRLVQPHDRVSREVATNAYTQLDETRRLRVLPEELDSLEVPA